MAEIRLAELADIPAIEALIPSSVRELSIGFYTPAQIEVALAHMFGVDTRLILDRTYFVAEEDGLLVACGGWSRRRTLFGGDQWKDEDDPVLDSRSEAARIRAFFVHPAYARRGIGRRILENSENAAREEGFKRLELVATLPGEQLYAAYGYASVQRYEIDVGGGVSLPAVKMEKHIS